MIIDIPLTRAVEQQFATASILDPTVNFNIAIALKQTLVVMAIGFAGLAIAIDGTSIYKLPSILASLLATALAAIIWHVEVKFERSYERS